MESHALPLPSQSRRALHPGGSPASPGELFTLLPRRSVGEARMPAALCPSW